MSESDIPKRLLQIRSESGLTQDAFASRLGYPKRTYLGWERGETAPPIGLLVALKRAFKIDPAWVLEGDAVGPRQGAEQVAEEAWRAALAVEEGCRRARVAIPRERLLIVIRAVYYSAQGRDAVDERVVDDLVSLAGADHGRTPAEGV